MLGTCSTSDTCRLQTQRNVCVAIWLCLRKSESFVLIVISIFFHISDLLVLINLIAATWCSLVNRKRRTRKFFVFSGVNNRKELYDLHVPAKPRVGLGFPWCLRLLIVIGCLQTFLGRPSTHAKSPRAAGVRSLAIGVFFRRDLEGWFSWIKKVFGGRLVFAGCRCGSKPDQNLISARRYSLIRRKLCNVFGPGTCCSFKLISEEGEHHQHKGQGFGITCP